jgi:hypothetical protein
MPWISDVALKRGVSWAQILSLIAVPIVLAVVGYFVQSSLAEQNVKKDYVQVAIGILQAPHKPDEEIKQWAVKVLEKHSPVPFGPAIRDRLLTFDATLYSNKRITAPAELLEPPLEYQSLPGERFQAENANRFRLNAAKLEALQKYVREVEAKNAKWDKLFEGLVKTPPKEK